MRTIVSAIVLFLIAITPAVAKSSKAQVAGNCLSQREARSAWSEAYLKYRVVDGRRCWYAPGKTMIAKRKKPVPVRIASRLPIPVQVSEPVAERVITQEPDNLDRVHQALCGGPCPRFDLDDPVYQALCGKPCPDFHAIYRIENAFDAFGHVTIGRRTW